MQQNHPYLIINGESYVGKAIDIPASYWGRKWCKESNVKPSSRIRCLIQSFNPSKNSNSEGCWTVLSNGRECILDSQALQRFMAEEHRMLSDYSDLYELRQDDEEISDLKSMTDISPTISAKSSPETIRQALMTELSCDFNISSEEELLLDRNKRFKPLPKFNQKEWTKAIYRRYRIVKFNRDQYGPTMEKQADFTALDWFNLFFPDKLWQAIANHSNSRVAQLLAVGKMSEQVVDWIPLDVKTLKAFVGMAIIMGSIKFPRVTMYWQQSRKYSSLGYFPYVLSMRRFSQILNNLEFDSPNSKSSKNTNDSLGKVRLLLDGIIPCFKQHYMPSEELRISQATLPYAGNYTLDARRHDGRCNSLNVRIISEISTGYIFNLHIDRASSSNSINDGYNRINCNQIRQLTQGLQHKNHKLYVDHDVMTAELVDHLLNLGFYACGLARSDCSDIPQALKRTYSINNNNHHHRGGSVVQWRMRQQTLVCAIEQSQSDPLYFFSSMHLPPNRYDMINDHILGRQQLEEYRLYNDYQRWEKCKLKSVLHSLYYFYNGGRYCKKWHRRVFFYLIECSLVNAFIVAQKCSYNNQHQQEKSLDTAEFLDFRSEIAEALIEQFLGNEPQFVVTKASNLQVKTEAEILHRHYTSSDYIHL
ncbi:PiggyBac transposable element-derived protein 4 [Trichoplax sp. H2]|nr:PiggyBac transposable element-derived protein 4 [Trichoplax sp. H2]|eukprot:RDD44186.1 PiggyBac transposable element-derived protein 4 [Trichoplax sp. H2]